MNLPEGMDAAELDSEDTAEYEYAEVILRPVQEFTVEPHDVQITFDSSEPSTMQLVPVTQMQYADGERIRQIEGASLTRTSLVLQMSGYLERLKGLVEVEVAPAAVTVSTTAEGDDSDDEIEVPPRDANMKLVVLETLTVRRDISNEVSLSAEATQTQLLVHDGQQIKAKTPLIKTQVLAKTGGIVGLGNAQDHRDVRRVVVMTSAHTEVVTCKAKPTCKSGDMIKADALLDDKTSAPVSGKILSVSKNTVTIRTGRPYLISAGAQLHAEDQALIQRGDSVATLVFERQKTGDIVQGLPRVEELLEGRKPKDGSIISTSSGTIETVDEGDGLTVFLTGENGREEITFPLGSNVLVEDGQEVKAGEPITDGSINPHDLLEVCGIVVVRKYLVDEVQRVYRSQGVEIADKHVEVIVRQMSKKVRIDENGDTSFLIGELVDEKDMNERNRQLTKKQNPAVGHPVLLGITKASLNTESFISAASFQETTRVLTEAAVGGKRDHLRGLKENVIIGRLIPAGTGFPNFADDRHDMIADDAPAPARSSARKPSAILEEIESMFGSPNISKEALAGDLLIDDTSSASAKSTSTTATAETATTAEAMVEDEEEAATATKPKGNDDEPAAD